LKALKEKAYVGMTVVKAAPIFLIDSNPVIDNPNRTRDMELFRSASSLSIVISRRKKIAFMIIQAEIGR